MRESKARSVPYEALFAFVRDGVVVYELIGECVKGYFIHANPAVCDMLGYTPEEMKWLTPMDIQDEKGREDAPFGAEE
jgi:PAS domain S-box-containing protein